MTELAWLCFAIAFVAGVAAVWQGYTLHRDLKSHLKELDDDGDS